MTQSIQNAIAKASRIKCAVKLLAERSYLVITPKNHQYRVTFYTHDGHRFGYCNCAAGVKDVPCYHVPKAALVDTAIQNMRRVA
jgi:hypothetical protein